MEDYQTLIDEGYDPNEAAIMAGTGDPDVGPSASTRSFPGHSSRWKQMRITSCAMIRGRK